jgi:hypothetical protein
MFAPGDEVRFLNEKGHGVIIRITQNSHAWVENDLGFILEYPIKQLVLVKSKSFEISIPALPLNKQSSPKPTLEDTKVSIPSPISNSKHHKLTQLKCGFTENRTGTQLSSWDLIINNPEMWPYYFTIRAQIGSHWFYLSHGSIESNSTQIVSTFLPEDISELKSIALQAIPFQLSVTKVLEPIDDVFKIKSPKLYNTNLFQVFQNFPKPLLVLNSEKKLMTPSSTIELPKKVVLPNKSNPVLTVMQEAEIDLHIEKLVSNHRSLSNHEKLLIQLKEVHMAMDKAFVNHCKKLTFIHGVGNGILKEETRKILKTYSAITLVDGDFAKYGFGATTVFFD